MGHLMKSSDHDPTLVVPGTTAPLVEPMRKEAQEQFRQLMDHLERQDCGPCVETNANRLLAREVGRGGDHLLTPRARARRLLLETARA